MVRGNFQKRLEKAEARRKESKQHKQRSKDKQKHKVWANELLELVDDRLRCGVRVKKKEAVGADDAENGDDGARARERPHHHDGASSSSSTSSSQTLHLWTETAPADSPPLLDIMGDDSGGAHDTSKRHSNNKKQRARSGSLGNNDKQTTAGFGKNKVHPRSKEATDNTDHQYDADQPLLCCRYFFTGRCDTKKGDCRYVHYSSILKTLADVVNADKKKGKRSENDETLALAEEAVSSLNQAEKAMDMVYYLSIELSQQELEEGQTWNDHIIEILSNKHVGVASIVYAVVNDELVYDRYRGGVVAADSNASSGTPRDSTSEAAVAAYATDLPAPILENILTFTDSVPTVGAFAQVCQTWHREIGRTPNLWTQLSQRRDWPLPTSKDVFRSHYTALRDVTEMRDGLDALSSGKLTNPKAIAYQDFSKTRNVSPADFNTCAGIQVWGANRILCGYANDCSLRLFEATRSQSNNKVCRQLVCHTVARNTKKRSYSLSAMGLDEEFIGCLCHVNACRVESEAFILVVISRDDFLIGDNNDDGESNHTVFDIGEAVLNYLLTLDDVNHRYPDLVQFLDDGGELSSIEILASHTMVSCGHGRFMFEVSISLPSNSSDNDEADDSDSDDDSTIAHLLCRKLVMFSSTVGAIAWMGDTNATTEEPAAREEVMSLAYLRHPHLGVSRSACSFVLGNFSVGSLMVGSVDPSGRVQDIHLVDSYEQIDPKELFGNDWVLYPGSCSHMVVTSEDLIVIDTMSCPLGHRRYRDCKTVVSFYRRVPMQSGPSHSSLILTGNLLLINAASVRNHHVVVLCREIVPLNDDDSDNDENRFREHLSALVIHIGSRRVVGRVRLIDDPDEECNLGDTQMSCLGGTIGAALGCRGCVVAGQDVRCTIGSEVVMKEDMPSKSAKKKKKPKGGSKGGKKDAFARGMSLRG